MTKPAGPVGVLGLLVGDVKREGSGANIKYGHLFESLAAACDLVDVCDVDLKGAWRYANAVRALRWPAHRWREAFRKNPWAFEQRSRRARALARQHADRADVVFQHGALFASDTRAGPPVVIYTDFTYRLTQREDSWRDPFVTASERVRWDNRERHVYHHAAYVMTRSEYARRSIIDDYGVPPDRVIAVGAGVNFAEIPAQPAVRASSRVLFIGKEFERKGGPQLVAAFDRVRQRVPGAELWAVTNNEKLTGPGIRRIAPTHDRDAIRSLYRSAAIFVMPSRSETWGDVFLEAMAYGVPCIGTTGDAMPEIIQHGETGYVVEPDDIDAMAAAIERLLLDPPLRQRMGASGYQRVVSHFTWERVVERMLPYLEAARSGAK